MTIVSLHAQRLATMIYPFLGESLFKSRSAPDTDPEIQGELYHLISIVMVVIQDLEDVRRGVDKKILTKQVGRILLERALPDEQLESVVNFYDSHIDDIIETLYWTARYWRKRSWLYKFCCW